MHFTEPGVTELLQYPAKRKRVLPEGIEDIFDGHAYQKMKSTHGHGLQITFLINADGVEILKSSNFNLWPVLLLINEFPPYMRLNAIPVLYIIFLFYFYLLTMCIERNQSICYLLDSGLVSASLLCLLFCNQLWMNY